MIGNVIPDRGVLASSRRPARTGMGAMKRYQTGYNPAALTDEQIAATRLMKRARGVSLGDLEECGAAKWQ